MSPDVGLLVGRLRYNLTTMNLSVIIPVYNEVNHIHEIIKRVQATKLAAEIVIVDDGSKDGTREALKEMDGKKEVRVILHEKNQGKGGAVVTGMKAATGDILLIQDEDTMTLEFGNG